MLGYEKEQRSLTKEQKQAVGLVILPFLITVESRELSCQS